MTSSSSSQLTLPEHPPISVILDLSHYLTLLALHYISQALQLSYIPHCTKSLGTTLLLNHKKCLVPPPSLPGSPTITAWFLHYHCLVPPPSLLVINHPSSSASNSFIHRLSGFPLKTYLTSSRIHTLFHLIIQLPIRNLIDTHLSNYCLTSDNQTGVRPLSVLP